jgi:hypothetical protein
MLIEIDKSAAPGCLLCSIILMLTEPTLLKALILNEEKVEAAKNKSRQPWDSEKSFPLQSPF